MSVQIDNDFARFGDKSYAINKINSIEIREEKPKTGGCAVILGLVGALFVMAAFGTTSDGGETGVTVTSLFMAALFGLGAYAFWRLGQRRTYRLFLMTSSSEAQAFVTKNRQEAFSLRDNLEAAMQHHSRKGSMD